jgi:WD40-like Beta Propeller Repeat
MGTAMCSTTTGGVSGGQEAAMKLKSAAFAVVPFLACSWFGRMKPLGVYPLVALALMLATRPHVTAAPKFSDWGEPTNLGCQINSAFGEQGPTISKNGLVLYFGSMRPDGFGASDLWVSQRASVHNPWGPPLNLGAIVNTPGVENIPALSRDEHWLFFNSDRAGTSGILDIWVSYRKHVNDDFAWQPPVNLGAGVNSPALEAGASYLETIQHRAAVLFFGRGQTLADFDIYMSELQPDGSLGSAVFIPELNSAQSDQRPSVRSDGLELFLSSDRAGTLGLSDLWLSTRRTVFDLWETPTNLGPMVNSSFADMQPYIAADRRTLFFTSSRPGGCGALDLYMTTRTKHVGPNKDE